LTRWETRQLPPRIQDRAKAAFERTHKPPQPEARPLPPHNDKSLPPDAETICTAMLWTWTFCDSSEGHLGL
jgi:hypothetical protein